MSYRSRTQAQLEARSLRRYLAFARVLRWLRCAP